MEKIKHGKLIVGSFVVGYYCLLYEAGLSIILIGVFIVSWVFEIFSDKSDQARLISILISAMVAIFVVLLNQWFLSRRAKREFLIKKIEELFSASNEYVASCRELLEALRQQGIDQSEKYFNYPFESVHRLNDSITKMQMICGLYFRSEQFSPEKFYIWNMPILEASHKGKNVPESEGYSLYQESTAHIWRSREALDELCKKLMKKYGH